MHNKIVILSLLIGLLALAVLYYHFKKTRRKKAQQTWGSPKPATKYHELFFDRDAGLFMTHVDVYFTELNGCPILFKSSDGKEILVDVYFSCVVKESEFKRADSNTRIEAKARKILSEELTVLTKGLNFEAIEAHSSQHIEAIRPNFNKRMREFVREVDHLVLIGQMRILERPTLEKLERTNIATSTIIQTQNT